MIWKGTVHDLLALFVTHDTLILESLNANVRRGTDRFRPSLVKQYLLFATR